jgi:predicted membrane metal-binding protein
MRSMCSLRTLHTLQGFCGQCSWVTGVLRIARELRIFKRRAFFTRWLWQVCTWGLSRSRFTGWDGSCGFRWTMLYTLTMLSAYVAVVEQRAPVLRAALMAAVVVVAGFFFRRLELLNSAALAALILLSAKPPALRDSSFQLIFVAIGCIGGLALPWLEKTVQPYVHALPGWRDLTRARRTRATPNPIQNRSALAGAVAFYAAAPAAGQANG